MVEGVPLAGLAGLATWDIHLADPRNHPGRFHKGQFLGGLC